MATAPPKPEPVMQAGYFSQFIFENEEAMRSITGIVEEEMKDMKLNTGHRSFFNLLQTVAIEPFLELIVEQAIKQASFPLKKNTRIQEVLLIVAPPDGSRSNSWTKGRIHRDFSSPEVSGVYTFLLCIDEVIEENGSIKMWCNSKKLSHDSSNPSRGKEGMDVKTLVGPKSTVFVWDARLLHQSLPNKSNNARTVLAWLVTSKSKPAVTIM